MAVKEIVRHWIMVCDCCGSEKNQTGTHRPTAWVQIDVKQDALDYGGSPCADASVSLLLCPKCGPKVVDAMNVASAAVRAALGKTP